MEDVFGGGFFFFVGSLHSVEKGFFSIFGEVFEDKVEIFLAEDVFSDVDLQIFEFGEEQVQMIGFQLFVEAHFASDGRHECEFVQVWSLLLDGECCAEHANQFCFDMFNEVVEAQECFSFFLFAAGLFGAVAE